MVGIESGKFLGFSFDGARRWPLAGLVPAQGLPWNLPAMRGIFAGLPPTFDGTSSQARQLPMSLKDTKPFIYLQVELFLN